MSLFGTTKDECLLGKNYKHSEMSAILWDMKGAISSLGSG
jgi:hypothetical protein